jgi:RNA-binding protein YhbY
MAMIKLQIGKKGMTQEFIENLKKIFEVKTNESARISLLKSSTRDKDEAKKWAEEILAGLGKNFTCKIVGYTLVLRKWRKGRV